MTNREITSLDQLKSRLFCKQKVVSDLAYVVLFASFIAFLQPFGMDQVNFWYSWFFWLAICTTGSFVYSPIIYVTQWLLPKYFEKMSGHYKLQIGLGVIVASIAMALIAPLIIGMFFGFSSNYWHLVQQSFFVGLFIGGIITLGATMKAYLKAQKQFIQQQQQTIERSVKTVEDEGRIQIAEFMQKLPIEKRGELYCLAMDDHYLNVYTDKGSHMVLMRFKDALALLDKVEGCQTHRSWWVANQAITSSEKDGRKLQLILKNDVKVPVSQTFQANVKAIIG